MLPLPVNSERRQSRHVKDKAANPEQFTRELTKPQFQQHSTYLKYYINMKNITGNITVEYSEMKLHIQMVGLVILEIQRLRILDLCK